MPKYTQSWLELRVESLQSCKLIGQKKHVSLHRLPLGHQPPHQADGIPLGEAAAASFLWRYMPHVMAPGGMLAIATSQLEWLAGEGHILMGISMHFMH